MYAVIETGGKQYRVAPGDTIQVETIPFEKDAEIEFSGVITVVNDDGGVLTGEQLANARVVATVAGSGRGEKIVIFKFKRKKQYKRSYGHRQNYTELKINDIVV
ncbi:MAG: 50S ribosomal protein L21 [Acidobacteria bacterium]|nr:50S ribosomal protein L21 [Acidobacteriota bacterium]MBI3281045.1 50S ribosomal protein L21 [Acidobacteriota bacterium]